MILSDKSLNCMLDMTDLIVFPLERHQVQPASIDIRLGDTFSTVKDTETIITFDYPVEYVTVKKETFLLMPQQFVLATTKEYFKLPNNLTAFVEGRSSVGRMGLFIQNAGWVDPGFEGEITLELYNASDKPILLEAGRRVGQLVFAQLDQCAENPYNGKYQRQRGATGSRIYLDKESNPNEND